MDRTDILLPLLEAADLALIAAGTVILAWALIAWLLGGRQDPLQASIGEPSPVTLPMLGVCLVGFFGGGLLGLILAPSLLPPTVADSSRQEWTALVSMFVAQGITIAACLAALSARPSANLLKPPIVRRLGWVLAGWLAALSLCFYTAWYSLWLIDRAWPTYDPPDHTIFNALSDPSGPPILRAAAWLSAALLAPLTEELFFRGVVQSSLRTYLWGDRPPTVRRWQAIAVTALLFGLMHSSTPHYIPALIVLGILLGYLYERCGTLTVPVLVHVLFNSKSLLWYYLS